MLGGVVSSHSPCVVEGIIRLGASQAPTPVAYFRNVVTDDHVPLFHSRCKRHRAFLRCVEANNVLRVERGLVPYVIHATVDDEHAEVGALALNDLLRQLRRRLLRAGLKSPPYEWVLEPHKRRWLNDGTPVRHWHIVIGIPDGWLPDVRSEFTGRYRGDRVPIKRLKVLSEGEVVEVCDLRSMWGKGRIYSERGHGSMAAYMGKYLSKELFSNPYGPRVRVYGSSKIPFDLKWPSWAVGARTEAEVNGYHGPDWDYRLEGSKVVLRGRVFLVGRCRGSKLRLVRHMMYRSPWIVDDGDSVNEYERRGRGRWLLDSSSDLERWGCVRAV